MQQAAAKKLRQYRLAIWAIFICTVGIYMTVYLTCSAAVTILTLLLCIPVILIAKRILFGRIILSVLMQKLDVDTYLAILREKKLSDPTAMLQLYGDYFSGNYANVIALCRAKMTDPKTPKKHYYYYLTYLGNVYFDTANDEKLRFVCAQFEHILRSEPPRKAKKYRKIFARSVLFHHYLNGNKDAMREWIDAPTSYPLTQCHRTFCKARLSLMEGNTGEARMLCEQLAATAPKLNYGMLAMRALEKVSTEEADGAPDFSMTVDETSTTTLPSIHQRRRRILLVCLIALLVFSLVLRAAEGIYLDRQYEKELDAYRENIRIAVENDYDNVVILDTFELHDGDNIVDTMFLCQSDTELILGCNFIYTDAPNETQYEVKASADLNSLSLERSPIFTFLFPATTSSYSIKARLYTVKADLPEQYCHLSTVTVNGQTVYLVIVSVTSTNAA